MVAATTTSITTHVGVHSSCDNNSNSTTSGANDAYKRIDGRHDTNEKRATARRRGQQQFLDVVALAQDETTARRSNLQKTTKNTTTNHNDSGRKLHINRYSSSNNNHNSNDDDGDDDNMALLLKTIDKVRALAIDESYKKNQLIGNLQQEIEILNSDKETLIAQNETLKKLSTKKDIEYERLKSELIQFKSAQSSMIQKTAKLFDTTEFDFFKCS